MVARLFFFYGPTKYSKNSLFVRKVLQMYKTDLVMVQSTKEWEQWNLFKAGCGVFEYENVTIKALMFIHVISPFL